MASILELRKKAEDQFPGYPVDFEDGSRIILKSSANFSEAERDAFNDKVEAVKALENDEGADIKAAHAAFVDSLASVSDDPDLATELLTKESTALLTVIFDEYGKHIRAQEGEGASKSAGAVRAPASRGKRSNR